MSFENVEALPTTFNHRYVKIDKADSSDCRIGDGAYGVVYRALDKETGDLVALKRIKLEGEEDGIPSTALREITLLKNLHHENVVQLLHQEHDAGRLYIVFELADFDLKKLMDQTPGNLSPDLVQSYTYQILSGLAYCHSHGVMHRDLKPQNLLVTRTGCLKLADFGLARSCPPQQRQLTVEVITRWYRAPEILLGCNRYTPSVDTWSVACIIAEMSCKEPLLPGDSEIDQIHKIFQLNGTPTEENFPNVTSMPFWRNNFPEWLPVSLEAKLPNLSVTACNLISQLMLYDPTRRLSAKDALAHPYIQEFRLKQEDSLVTPKHTSKPSSKSMSCSMGRTLSAHSEDIDGLDGASSTSSVSSSVFKSENDITRSRQLVVSEGISRAARADVGLSVPMLQRVASYSFVADDTCITRASRGKKRKLTGSDELPPNASRVSTRLRTRSSTSIRSSNTDDGAASSARARRNTTRDEVGTTKES